MRKFLRVALVANTYTHLLCVACGRFNCDFAIAVADDEEPQAGVHKKCIGKVKAKRGAA